MSVLPFQEIIRRIQDDNLIEGGCTDTCVGPSSYELRIGTALNLSDNRVYEIGEGVEFAMKPQSHLLVGTIEKVNMPNDLCATMFLKSKFGRGGFIPWGQGFIDPGYSGKLTVSLINMSPFPKIFSGGDSICHLIFQGLMAETVAPYDGVYSGSLGAQGPKEKPMLVLGTPVGEIVGAGLGGLISGVAQGMVS